jgi:hypothetical protein
MNSLPTISVFISDSAERAETVALIRQAGFTAYPADSQADTVATLAEQRCSAAVVALPGPAMRAFIASLPDDLDRSRIVLVADGPEYLIDDERSVVLQRPLDTPRLIGALYDIALSGPCPDERPGDTARQHRGLAELGIAAARLACLCMREAGNAATSGSLLVQELSRQAAAAHTALFLTGTPIAQGTAGGP